MKKILAAISTLLLVGAFAFAEGYINANDVELGVITDASAQEDGFVLNGVPEKALEVTKSDAVTVGDDTFTQRFKMGSNKATGISFPAKKGEKVTIYGLSSGKSEARVVIVRDAEGKTVAELPVNAYDASNCQPQSFKVPEDGTYIAGSKKNTVYIYQITVGK